MEGETQSRDRPVGCIEGKRRDGATPTVAKHTADREIFSGAGVGCGAEKGRNAARGDGEA